MAQRRGGAVTNMPSRGQTGLQTVSTRTTQQGAIVPIESPWPTNSYDPAATFDSSRVEIFYCKIPTIDDPYRLLIEINYELINCALFNELQLVTFSGNSLASRANPTVITTISSKKRYSIISYDSPERISIIANSQLSSAGYVFVPTEGKYAPDGFSFVDIQDASKTAQYYAKLALENNPTINSALLNILSNKFGNNPTQVSINPISSIIGNSEFEFGGKEGNSQVGVFWRKRRLNNPQNDWNYSGTHDINARLSFTGEGNIELLAQPYSQGIPTVDVASIIIDCPISEQDSSIQLVETSKNQFRIIILDDPDKRKWDYLVFETQNSELSISSSEDINVSDNLKFLYVNDNEKEILVSRFKYQNIGTFLLSREKLKLKRHFNSTTSTRITDAYISNSKISARVNIINFIEFAEFESDVEAYSGNKWVSSITNGSKVLYLEIIERNSSGGIASLGMHPLAFYITNGVANFVENSILEDLEVKNYNSNRGRYLDFNINIPLSKNAYYELRLHSWTSGIDECLRSSQEYKYLKDNGNSGNSGKRSYSTWTNEHPSMLNSNISPVDFDGQRYPGYSSFNSCYLVYSEIQVNTSGTFQSPNGKIEGYIFYHIDLIQQDIKFLLAWNLIVDIPLEDQLKLDYFSFSMFNVEDPLENTRRYMKSNINVFFYPETIEDNTRSNIIFSDIKGNAYVATIKTEYDENQLADLKNLQ